MAKNRSYLLRYIIFVSQTPKDCGDISFVLAGHADPGEGEHKIMEYIRSNKLRGGPAWPPNLRHCLYGLDADLIMLALATHEPNFVLLREDVAVMDRRRYKKLETDVLATPWQLLHLCLVREYLDLEFRSLQPKLRFPYDLEKIIDDFVFLCFFIGNDFLPSLPFLTIANGSLNTMIDLYKVSLVTGDGYFTSSGKIHWGRCLVYLNRLKEMELDRLRDLADHNKLVERRKKSMLALIQHSNLFEPT
jgi:5'-3' exoribonuclease 1